MLRTWLSLLFLLLPFGLSAGELGPLTIETDGGDRTFRVELVDTPRTRAQGLMHRESMPQDEGMLFDFGETRQVSFWMKNTLIPLDMLFIDQAGVIVHIHHQAIPHDRTAIRSGVPIRAVLEINGGLSKMLGIRTGDRVRHDMFGADG
ncbi:DUF192 domain-containing protein [Minwuia sp.]|uniref:DUF192 domain-containing protein n=1 Tax=Minwuia sp. TaxID=2493630 RepID=UPI003A92910A